MDSVSLRKKTLLLRARLKENGVRLDAALLFGSRAKGTARLDSDYDIAIVSKDFGKSRFQEAALLGRLSLGLELDADLVPVGLLDYLDPQTISPILAEIKSTGIPII